MGSKIIPAFIGGWRSLIQRWVLALGIAFLFPFPLGALPKTTWLAEVCNKPIEWLTRWFGESVLGLGPLANEVNGSGDRTYDYVNVAVVVGLSLIATLAWCVLDRRSVRFPRLVAVLHVALRYAVAHAMLLYGLDKVFKLQFPDLSPARMSQEIGDISPMRLLWTFMGYSTPYTVFAGLAEVFGGLLLLWRRTATLGALIVMAVMVNVVMLNFSYDVCVKLYSSQLLVMALAIAWPRLRAVLAAMLGHAVAAAPLEIRMCPRRERARGIVKLAVLVGFACSLYGLLGPGLRRHVQPSELYGRWRVERIAIDGVDQPPLLSDAPRWRALAVTTRWLVIFPMAGGTEDLGVTIDPEKRTISVTLNDDDKDKGNLDHPATETWTYTRPTPGQLVIDGPHRGHALHVVLHLDPERNLMTRGFHWINDDPYNR